MIRLPKQARPELRTHVILGLTVGLVVFLLICIVSAMPHYVILVGALGGGLVGFQVWMIRFNRYRSNPANFLSKGEDVTQIDVNRLTPLQRLAHEKVLAQIRRRKLAKIREKKNLIAQFNKPDFDSRLDQFVSENVKSTSPTEEPETFVSKDSYWQRETFGEPTRPKPLEFIRQILLRISRIIHGTGT